VIELSRRVRTAKPSATLAVAAKARELKAKGVDVVAFGTGEPDFDTPAHIKAAAKKALDEGMTSYPPLTGIPELRKAVVGRLKAERGLEYSADEVLVTVGAKQAIYNLCQAVLDEGQEAVIVAPYWVSYPEMVALAGAEPVIVQTRAEDGFAPTADTIAAAMNDRTRLLFLNSPSNPAGAVYTRETLEAVAEVVRKYPKVVVMTDDIYARILFEGDFVSFAMAASDLRDRTVIVDGVSKAYAMTGWRLGWAVAETALIKPMSSIQGQSTSGATAFAQAGAVAALTGDQSVVDEMVGEFRRRRDHIVARLDAIDGVSCRAPGGAFYAFPDVRGLMGKRYGDETIATSGDVTRLLIEHHAVAAVDGAPFGAEGFLRLSFATSMEQIDLGVDRLAEMVAALS
jgi:aspartate aminotransferase